MKQLIFLFLALLTVSCNAQNSLKNSTKESKTVGEKHPPALQDTVQLGFFQGIEPSTANLAIISKEEYDAIRYDEERGTTVFIKRNKHGFRLLTGNGEIIL